MSVFSRLRQLTKWHCPRLIAVCTPHTAARLLLTAGRAAVYRYLLPAGPTAANPPQRAAGTVA